ncbi:hypothetical protein EV401DRAFT_2193872, partial [Pisolithus croceorrhizus]
MIDRTHEKKSIFGVEMRVGPNVHYVSINQIMLKQRLQDRHRERFHEKPQLRIEIHTALVPSSKRDPTIVERFRHVRRPLAPVKRTLFIVITPYLRDFPEQPYCSSNGGAGMSCMPIAPGTGFDITCTSYKHGSTLMELGSLISTNRTHRHGGQHRKGCLRRSTLTATRPIGMLRFGSTGDRSLRKWETVLVSESEEGKANHDKYIGYNEDR